MTDFYRCRKCGDEYDRHADHEAYCPGSPAERIEALEAEIAELRTVVAALVWVEKFPRCEREPWVTNALVEALEKGMP